MLSDAGEGLQVTGGQVYSAESNGAFATPDGCVVSQLPIFQAIHSSYLFGPGANSLQYRKQNI